ncbi:DUF881 domain-containing protein [Schaalia sp. 19OD2882]|nr:DUF881 domain-containing protein [Schaalia sp. 19OD2882]
MSLLTGLLRNPLDAGYAAWENGGTHKPRWWERMLTVLLAVALGVACTWAVRALRVPERIDIHDELLDRALTQQSAVAALEDSVQSLAQEVEAAGGSTAAGARLDPALALAVAAQDVTGPGLLVTLKNSADTSTPSGGLVRDQDIRMVVNALWSAGAEAVTVNGIRVGPATFIRTAGASVLVNVTPISSPYEIRAIGDANTMSTALVRGSTGDYLSSVESVNGISVAASAQTSISMPALDVRTLRHATESTGGQ